MARPKYYEKGRLLISEHANELAHNSIGTRGRRFTYGLLTLSTLLSAAAASAGLANLISKTGVSIITLAAALSTAIVILLLTTLKYDAHLRAMTRYGDLYQRTVQCDVETPDGVATFGFLWEEFRRTAEDVDREGANLTPGQIHKYERIARKDLPEAGEMLPEPPPRWEDFQRILR